MTVYIIMRHDYRDCLNENVIVTICLTEEAANKKLKWIEEGAPDNEKFWIEDYSVDTDV